MKDNYTLKEILLGLRSEQEKVASGLECLKACLWEFYEKRNSFFSVNPEENTIIYFYKFTDKSLKGNVIPVIPFEFKKNSSGDFTNFYLPVKLIDQERFNLMCENILASEFVNNSNLEIKTKEGSLKIHPTYMHYISENLKLLNVNCFLYFAKDDLVFLQSLKRNKKELFESLFNLEFSREYFSEYLQNIIDSNLETKKDIIIPGEKSLEKNMHFYLNQERENYVLVKKKK